MNRLVRLSLVVAACAVIASCGILPANVQNPSDEQQRMDNPELHTYQGVRPVAKSQHELTLQFDAYVGVWRKNEHDLATQIDGAEAFQFASLVWAAYKTATGHLHDAKWGVAAAGGVSLLADRFQLLNQSHTYSNAADAMSCIRTRVEELPSNFWALYDANSLTVDQDALTAYLDADDTVTKEVAQQNYETIVELYPTINSHMSEVEGRLRGSLEKTNINVPNSDDILKATQKFVAIQGQAASGANALTAAFVARSVPLSELRQAIATVNVADSVSFNLDAQVKAANDHYFDIAAGTKKNLLLQVDVQAVKSNAPLASFDAGAASRRAKPLDEVTAVPQIAISQAALTVILDNFFATLHDLPPGGRAGVPSQLASAVPAGTLQPLLDAQVEYAQLKQSAYVAERNLAAAKRDLSAKVADANLQGSDALAASFAFSATNADTAPLDKKASDAQKLAAVSKATYAKAIALPSALDTCVTKIASP
jgi:hypothetical protein